MRRSPLLSHELGGGSLLIVCRLEELCSLVLGVGALHSLSNEMKTYQKVNEVSSRKIFFSQNYLGERSFLVAEDEVEGCACLVEG